MKLGFEESQSPTPAARKRPAHGRKLGSVPGLIARIAATQRFRLSPTTVRLRISFARPATKSSNSKARRENSAPGLSTARSKPNANVLAASNNPNLLPDELRSQIACGRKSLHRAKAFFRPRDHRGTKATGRYRAARGLDRFENPAQIASPSPAKIHIVQNGVIRAEGSSSLRNGRRRYSSGTNRRKRAAGCSTS